MKSGRGGGVWGGRSGGEGIRVGFCGRCYGESPGWVGRLFLLGGGFWLGSGASLVLGGGGWLWGGNWDGGLVV